MKITSRDDVAAKGLLACFCRLFDLQLSLFFRYESAVIFRHAAKKLISFFKIYVLREFLAFIFRCFLKY